MSVSVGDFNSSLKKIKRIIYLFIESVTSQWTLMSYRSLYSIYFFLLNCTGYIHTYICTSFWTIVPYLYFYICTISVPVQLYCTYTCTTVLCLYLYFYKTTVPVLAELYFVHIYCTPTCSIALHLYIVHCTSVCTILHYTFTWRVVPEAASVPHCPRTEWWSSSTQTIVWLIDTPR